MLGSHLPIKLYAATCASLLALVVASAVGPIAALSVKHLCGLFVAMYIGQEMAHWITYEKTFQDSYIQQQDWMAQLAVHTFYLIPLCLDSTMHMRTSFFSWLLPHNYIVATKLNSREDEVARR